MNTHTSPKNPVGKSFANSTQKVANSIELADVCQLRSLSNQPLTFSWQLATEICGAKLPTQLSPCFCSSFSGFSVGENSPYLYEIGRQTPLTRFCLPSFLGRAFVGFAGVVS